MEIVLNQNGRGAPRQYLRRIVLSTVSFLTVVTGTFVMAAPAMAAQHENGMVDLYWTTDEPKDDITDVTQYMSIDQKAPKTFWSTTFVFASPKSLGYMGLQTDGNRSDGSRGEMGIFSVQNADGYRNHDGTCVAYGNEGVGLSCRAAMPVNARTIYRYRLKGLETDESGRWWGAWIDDVANRTTVYLGDLHGSSEFLTTKVINFSEYWGTAVACDAVPESRVTWYTPGTNVIDESQLKYQHTGTYLKQLIESCITGTLTAFEPVDVSGVGKLGGYKVTAGSVPAPGPDSP